MDFRNLAVALELVLAEGPSRKGGFVFFYPPYDVQIEQYDDHEGDDVFRSSKMKDIARCLCDILRSEAFRHPLCCVVRVALWYIALALSKKKNKIETQKTFARPGLRAGRVRF